jgi:hexokinase
MATVQRFLEESGLALRPEDLRKVHDAMRAAIRQGLESSAGSLRMIPAYVPLCQAPRGQRAIALDAGGTNVRAALVEFDDAGEPTIVRVERTGLPGAGGVVVDRRTFFATLADLVGSLQSPGVPLGFVFSYPTRILPDRDGVLLRWTKEVKAEDVVGTRVGHNLVAALQARHGAQPVGVTVLNDTVAALAAGAIRISGTGGAIGLIVGTGTNMAYFEQRAAIKKLPPDEAGPPEQAINMESGNFDGVPATCYDEALDAASDDPGRQLMEKMVSGRYLGELCRRVLRGARGKNVLGGSIVDELAQPWTLGSADVAAALERTPVWQGPLAKLEASQRETVTRLLRTVVDRAARLVAAGLAAVVDHLGLAAAPVAIVAEGTMFWQMPGFRETVESTLDELTPPIGGAPRFVMLHIDEPNLVGAAVAALS